MFKFLKKSKDHKDSAEEAFLKAEAQFTGNELVKVDENLKVVYNSDKEILEKRFELLNDSYNQLLRVEKEKRAKTDLTNKVVARKSSLNTVPRRKVYKIPKIKLQAQLSVPFNIDNLDEYFAEAIHGITTRNIIDNEIQNEINEIRTQMALSEKNLTIDRRKFQSNLTVAEQLERPSLPPHPAKSSEDILEDVYSELDSMINGDKAYIVNGKASIVRQKYESKKPSQLKKAIKNIRV